MGHVVADNLLVHNTVFKKHNKLIQNTCISSAWCDNCLSQVLVCNIHNVIWMLQTTKPVASKIELGNYHSRLTIRYQMVRFPALSTGLYTTIHLLCQAIWPVCLFGFFSLDCSQFNHFISRWWYLHDKLSHSTFIGTRNQLL